MDILAGDTDKLTKGDPPAPQGWMAAREILNKARAAKS